MGYTEGAKKYADKFLLGICPSLVEAGEFKDVDECFKAGRDNASSQASNWSKIASKRMAEYLKH